MGSDRSNDNDLLHPNDTDPQRPADNDSPRRNDTDVAGPNDDDAACPNDSDVARLRKVLGGPPVAWLIDRLRERIARGRPLTGSVRLDHPTAEQRAAIERLLGRRAGAGGSVSVPLDRLGSVLRESGIHSGTLEAAVVALSGPVIVLAESRAALEREWAHATARGAEHVEHTPALRDWWETVTRRGVLRRIAGDPATAAPLISDLVTVLRALPVERELLGSFAARVLHGAHALDPDRPLNGLLTGALRAMAELPDAADRRTVLASAGLVVDELSSTVLTLGLTATDDTPAGRGVNAFQSIGEPLILTLRQLSRDAPKFRPGADISLCENPAVLAAAADRHGPSCRPLICTSGQPGAAVMRLLDLLAAAGSTFRYHGDFDWYGLAIATFVRRAHPWRPWRFVADDYLRATAPAQPTPLTGTPRAAAWDPLLPEAMISRGIQIEEELILPDLLDDLAPR